MFRFKLGLAVGFGLGWLVTSGKGAELIDRFRSSRSGADTAPTAESSGVYDFAVRAAQ